MSDDPMALPAEAQLKNDQAAQVFREVLAFTDVPSDGLSIATLPNLRDVGGWATSSGQSVRRGVLYRSVAPDRLDEPGLSAFSALGIRTVFDLRTAGERAAAPDRVPDGTAVVTLDVLADETTSVPAYLAELVSEPATIREHLGKGRAEALFTSAYRSFVTLPSALSSYRALYSRLAVDDSRPALFHCTTGKDRTGWAAAALLTWLGVSEADVMTDYLRTNELLRPTLQPIFDRFADAGGDTDILDAILGVRQAYIESAFDEMHSRYGSVERYFDEGLALAEDVQLALRTGLLD
jgi:protein-tyrosine phosphatase